MTTTAPKKQLVHDIVFVAEDLAPVLGERNAWRRCSHHLDGPRLLPLEVQRRADHIEKFGNFLGDAANEVSSPSATLV